MNEIKRFVKKVLRKTKKIKNKLKNDAYHLFHRLTYKLIPVDQKMVMFMSFLGRGYSDNPKALYEYMQEHEEYKGYKIIWVISHYEGDELNGVKIVKYFSLAYFYYLAKSKYWLFNAKLPRYICKKRNQVYLQTWHGTPLKRLAHDIEADENTTFYASKMSKEQMCRTYDIDVERYNYMVSPNSFCTEVFQSAFRINRERLIETGYPRNDFLSNLNYDTIIALKNKYGIPLNKKVILYAPTWRDNSMNKRGSFIFQPKVDFKTWKEVLGEDYVVIYKPHYLIVNKFKNNLDTEGFIYSIDAKADIRDLYAISDLLITDYSSVFFDFAILKRPMIFYMFDLDEYREELRGFYFDITEGLPGDIIKEETELLNRIPEVLNEGVDSRIIAFNEKFNHLEDGHSCKRVLDIVFNNNL